MEREQFSLQDSWEHVGEIYRMIVSLFGAPFEIAVQLLLMRKQRREILQWLGPVEALARRLLLLEALSLPTPNYAPPKALKGPLLIAFTDRPVEDIDPDSETWRVRFCAMPHGVLCGARRQEPCADRRGGGINYNALPLARRLEALRRVLENPDAALARLCRLLATQRQAVEAAFRPYRPRATCVQTTLMQAQRQIERALNTS